MSERAIFATAPNDTPEECVTNDPRHRPLLSTNVARLTFRSHHINITA